LWTRRPWLISLGAELLRSLGLAPLHSRSLFEPSSVPHPAVEHTRNTPSDLGFTRCPNDKTLSCGQELWPVIHRCHVMHLEQHHDPPFHVNILSQYIEHSHCSTFCIYSCRTPLAHCFVVSAPISPGFSHFASRRLVFDLPRCINLIILRNRLTLYAMCRTSVAFTMAHSAFPIRNSMRSSVLRRCSAY